MAWFRRQSRPEPRLSTDLGVFRFDGAGWITEPSRESISFQFLGEELDLASIDLLRQHLEEIDQLRTAALEYARRQPGDAWDGQGQPILEAIDFTDLRHGRFGLTFGFDQRPDFTVTVEFRHGAPAEVWAAD